MRGGDHFYTLVFCIVMIITNDMDIAVHAIKFNCIFLSLSTDIISHYHKKITVLNMVFLNLIVQLNTYIQLFVFFTFCL